AGRCRGGPAEAGPYTRRDRAEDAQPVRAAEQRLRAALGVGHHAEDVAGAVADPGDRARGAVRIRLAGQSPLGIAVPEDDLAIAFELVERGVVGEVIAFTVSNGRAEDLSLRQRVRERRVGLLDAQQHLAAEEAEVLVAHQRAGE